MLESQNPPLLRILDAANRALSRAGRIVTVTGIGALTIACVGGVYVLLSSYGAFALREFYGPAYYDLHLGDDAGAWYVHIPQPEYDFLTDIQCFTI